MNHNTALLILAIFALVFALPAAVVEMTIPAAIAQEEDDSSLGEDFAGNIVSDVLGGRIDDEDDEVNDDTELSQDTTNSGTPNSNQQDNSDVQFGDDTNAQIAVPVIDEEQRQANIAAQLAADLDIENQQRAPPECPPGFALEANGECRSTETTEPV